MSRTNNVLIAAILASLLISRSIPQKSNAPAEISGVAWSSDGLYLAAADAKGHITCWDASTRNPVWDWQGSEHGILKMFFDSQRHAFLVLERFGHAVLLSEKEGQVALDLEIDFGERDGNYVAGLSTGGFDDASETLAVGGNILSSVHVINLRAIPNAPVKQTVALGKMIGWRRPPIAKGIENTSAIVWIARKQPSVAEIGDLSVGETDDDFLADLAVCQGGTVELGVTRSGWLVGWDLTIAGVDKTRYRRHVIEGSHDSNYLLDVRCGPNSHVVSTGTTEKYGTIQLWNEIEGVMTFSKDTGSHSLIELDAVFSQDGSQLVTNGDLSYIWWHVESNSLQEVAVLYHVGSDTPIELRGNFAFKPNSHAVALSEGTALLLVDVDKQDISCFTQSCGAGSFHLRMVNTAISAPAQKPS
jgi:WD40 repeat protein